MGKILRVNLTSGTISEDGLNPSFIKAYLGGRGLGAKLLFDELPAGVDPLGSKNKLIFATGPFTGAPFPGNSRYIVMAKSPLTEIWGEANAAGDFGIMLKSSGYDALIIEGKAEMPVYLWIHDHEVELKTAHHLWGTVTGDATKRIVKEIKQETASVACIGPGGENLVRYACVISDLMRAAGRTGMGAVMGAKKLKAVAVYGTERISIADEEQLKELARVAVKDAFKGWGQDLHNHGTASELELLHFTGRLPTQAFRKCTFKGAEKITGETMTQTILVSQKPCFGCPISCHRVVEAKDHYEVDPQYGGPEYETCAAFGSLCMNDNLEAIAKANELCNKYTLDTISTGVSIAFAMECYEKGLIGEKELDGLDLEWGNHEAMIQLIEKIARREGIGNVLADGVRKASEAIGQGSSNFALHIKGLELPMHEVRGKKGLGLSYATSSRGACHLQSFHDDFVELNRDLAPEIGLNSTIAPRHRLSTGPEKVRMVKIGEDLHSVYNSLIICEFPVWWTSGIRPNTFVRAFSAVTRWDVRPQDLMPIGERISNLCRAFNVREGITRKDDTLPERLMEPLPEGLYKGEAISLKTLNQMLDAYYEFRRWDTGTGIPQQELLEDLDLPFVVEELRALKIFPIK
ncbi:MAG: aldehyde ferredoxin oxidoreductase family protein [Candidatus Bathyarchaeota archaeon]|nr:MAG: aldehyde ferredoxin oxidoreductase family protein [Candidatus Bathyarchaeota archaeon]